MGLSEGIEVRSGRDASIGGVTVLVHVESVEASSETGDLALENGRLRLGLLQNQSNNDTATENILSSPSSLFELYFLCSLGRICSAAKWYVTPRFLE